MQPTDIRRLLKRPVPTAYSPLIARMRFFIEPEISCSRFFAEACFTLEALAAYRGGAERSVLEPTELGGVIAEQLREGLLIDIPCGIHALRDREMDFDLVPLAQALGFGEVWEVDITADIVRDRVKKTIDVTDGGKGYRLAKGIGDVGTREENGLPVATMQDDLLGFIAKIPDAGKHSPLALYISALQPDVALCADKEGQRRIIAPYFRALYRELERVIGPEDLLILNSTAMLGEGVDTIAFPDIDPDIALLQRGFTVLRRDRYDKVRLYSRS